MKYICPSCRKVESLPADLHFCGECSKGRILPVEMLRVAEKLTRALKGRAIVAVAYPEDCRDRAKEEEAGLECDAGEIYLFLDDGSRLVFWNSEWGGVDWERGKK